MNVVIIGNGKVGKTIAQRLSLEKHDVVIIDTNNANLQSTINELDVIGVCGNGATHSVQLEAGVAGADLVIAATSADELNMLCCLVAKKLGARNTIARVRSPEYASQAIFLREELGLSLTINPEYMAAVEIARILRFPSANQIDTFANGKIELVQLNLPSGSPLHGIALSKLRDVSGARILICAVQRGNRIFIPDGDFILATGDIINITGASGELEKFLRTVGLYKECSRSVMIIGGGKIAYYLAKELEPLRINVKIIEMNRDRCLELSSRLPKTTIICADGSDLDLLMEEGISTVDALVSVTNIDEENMIMSMFGVESAVGKVIAKVNRPTFSKMLLNLGINSVITPKYITADVIVRYSRALANSRDNDEIQTLHKLLEDRVEALEFIAPPGAEVLEVPLKTLKLKKNLRIASIVRKGVPILPEGGTVINAGDSVIVVTTGAALSSLDDILE